MKKILIIFAFVIVSVLISSNQYAKEPAKKAAAPKETVPLITEVMSKEELQAYLKEKGIPIITKENFKAPELVWERTFDEAIREISDITEKGNCILLSGPVGAQAGKPQQGLLFVNSKGEI